MTLTYVCFQPCWWMFLIKNGLIVEKRISMTTIHDSTPTNYTANRESSTLLRLHLINSLFHEVVLDGPHSPDKQGPFLPLLAPSSSPSLAQFNLGIFSQA